MNEHNETHWNGLVQLAMEQTTSLSLMQEEDQYYFHLSKMSTAKTTFHYYHEK